MNSKLTKYFNILVGMSFLFSIFTNTPVKTGYAAASIEPFEGKPLCLPGIYLQPQDACLALGPSEYLTELARQGITFPPPPLPVSSPSVELNKIPFHYAKVVNNPAPLYASIGDADGRVPMRYLASKIAYISYKGSTQTDYGFYYITAAGVLIDGGDVARAAPPTFQGLLVRQTPEISFGWILTQTVSRSAPGFNSPETKNAYNRLNIVRVYEVTKFEKNDWVRIGANEWIEDRVVARVTPNVTPPKGIDNNRWIEVNLAEQTMLVYDQGQLVFATMVSSGVKPFYTRPGIFKVFKKLASDHMSGSFESDKSDYYYLEDVPWVLYFDGLRALHGAYWHTLFGYARSHGCVNLSIGDARWLYDWAKDGEWVYVWDPSGETPTDPKYYTQGGA